MKVVGFKELVEAEYFSKGFNKEQVLSHLHKETNVCRHSLRAALNGTRVAPETARALTLWAMKNMHVDLDEPELTRAPTKPRGRGDPGKRAEESVEAAVHEACLPPELACVVALDLSSGLWNVSCRNLTGGPANTQTAADLSDALRAVRESHHGRRSA